jgi:type VI secretion system protein ImpF
MARDYEQQGLLPSLLDRLIDADSEGTSFRHGYSLEQIIDSIRRDLEELLNAHPPHMKVPDDWPELNNSLITFGMPDLISATINTPGEKEELGRVVERIVERFEPRLRNVRAVLAESGQGNERDVRFHIEAELNVDPAPTVTFETVLELTTGQAKIESTS